jgi:peroxiredoxin
MVSRVAKVANIPGLAAAPSECRKMARLRLRELLRHCGVALLGRPASSGIYPGPAAPGAAGSLVSVHLSGCSNTDIIEEKMTLSKILLAVVAVAAVCANTACSNPETAEAAVKENKDRKLAPPFTLKDATGQPVQLANYKGKVVLLDFWATWCAPCKVEIPWFMEFEQQFKDRGFEVVGVSMDEDGWSVVKPYVEQLKINYRILLGNDQVGQLYGGVDSLPTTFLIDRQGKIASVHVGLERGKEDFKNDIVKLLETSHAASGAPARNAQLASAR